MFSKLLFALFTMIMTHTAMAQSLWPQSGNFLIVSRTNGNQALAVRDGSTTPGANIIVTDPLSTQNGASVWHYEFDNMLINRRSRLALSVHKFNATSGVSIGTNVVQEQVNTSSTVMVQQWNYFAGSGQIHPSFAGDLCVTAGRQLNKGIATIERCVAGRVEQSWTVTRLPSS
ncbi:hypothetical protein AGABI1DRAFT_116608 [Agaricus bisporus var. burnettii JB137-S8]|uniref:Uncharacterized protein n=1 Tax=Agaricus bisporus var. burnettii (strain JB137-S8 / ATCC MYA-4627 / FGSC 10392) TaxID=597362 RepID=K5XKJ8_AGABU|nr:uncharacterized protein AGABI1DRAFT_116608 [Agaricus bisporus var. burnettii JB137-S8]EKM75035.1 hypothetical protein AGABI1DRAFT_116608 [Agaricus bisporus var. burnettii JB137-S8]